MRPRNHHPTLTHPLPNRPPTNPHPLLSSFSSSISVPPPPTGSSSFAIFLFPLALFPFPPSCPSSCLWQPYKPWSSAAASSFTRAMYPDVSEGRNFASVCVLLFSFSLSPLLLTPPLSLSFFLSPDFPVLARCCERERERVRADACAQPAYVRV